MSQFNTINDVWAFLDTIPMFQKKGVAAANFSLDNIRAFCEGLGNPQDQYPVIHVAGTNGKGTTCYLLEKVYSDASFKTGMFTSPHLLRYNERVRVNKSEINESALLEFFQKAESLFSEIRLTYFEISTALAFWYFAEQQVDIAIIETGLGGRLDSTNIITPEISVITSIGLDHQNILGSSVEEISREKAGIIKQGKPVVLGNVDEKSQNVIEQIAAQKTSEIYFTKAMHPEWEAGRVTLRNGEIDIQTKFLESINKWNIACAWFVVEILQDKFPVERNGFNESLESFSGVPARFEKLHPEFEWYFSGSHNAQAVESSIETLQTKKPVYESVLVFSAMKDKLNSELLQYFKNFRKVYFVEQEGERAIKFEELNEKIDAKLITETTKEIIFNELKTELVIFMGSFYFYPIVKRWITNVS